MISQAGSLDDMGQKIQKKTRLGYNDAKYPGHNKRLVQNVLQKQGMSQSTDKKVNRLFFLKMLL